MELGSCYSCGQSLDGEGFCTNLDCRVTINQNVDQDKITSDKVSIVKKIETKSIVNDRFKNLDESTKQIVLAQDRTTHAIRSVVRFFFIQLSATTIAILILGLGFGTGNEVFSGFLAFIIYVVGLIWSSNVGWSELEKSNIPK
jgi:hypothetical protein